MVGDQAQRCLSPISDDMTLDANAYPDASACLIWDRTSRALRVLEGEHAGPKDCDNWLAGGVLDDKKLEDHSLLFLASSSSNISI